jgi:hypothetical protein
MKGAVLYEARPPLRLEELEKPHVERESDRVLPKGF